jgi:hypothetical protein
MCNFLKNLKILLIYVHDIYIMNTLPPGRACPPRYLFASLFGLCSKRGSSNRKGVLARAGPYDRIRAWPEHMWVCGTTN